MLAVVYAFQRKSWSYLIFEQELVLYGLLALKYLFAKRFQGEIALASQPMLEAFLKGQGNHTSRKVGCAETESRYMDDLALNSFILGNGYPRKGQKSKPKRQNRAREQKERKEKSKTSDEELEELMKDQPLSADASPTALSPGYIADSNPEEDKEDPEEDPADHPANG
ncbi:hypothetical protein Tco_0932253 [Tanacetum coccineum]